MMRLRRKRLRSGRLHFSRHLQNLSTAHMSAEAATTSLKNLILRVLIPHLREATFKLFGEDFQNLGAELGLRGFDCQQRLAIAQARGAVLVQHHGIERMIDGFEFLVGDFAVQRSRQ